MGTHPIFESDFDCLTESDLGPLIKNMAASVPEALKKKRVLYQAALAKARLRHSHPWYQPGLTPRQENPPAPPSPPDRQFDLCQVEQGHQHDAQHRPGAGSK